MKESVHYHKKPPSTSSTRRSEIPFGILMFLAFAAGWTVDLVRGGFTWWSLLTGFFAFVGIAAIIGSTEPPNPSIKTTDVLEKKRGEHEQAGSSNDDDNYDPTSRGMIVSSWTGIH